MTFKKLLVTMLVVGAAMFLAAGGVELTSAVGHEQRIQAQPAGLQPAARKIADSAQAETVRNTNQNLGWPGLGLMALAVVLWGFKSLWRQGISNDEPSVGRADPELFAGMTEELEDDTSIKPLSYQDFIRDSKVSRT